MLLSERPFCVMLFLKRSRVANAEGETRTREDFWYTTTPMKRNESKSGRICPRPEMQHVQMHALTAPSSSADVSPVLLSFSFCPSHQPTPPLLQPTTPSSKQILFQPPNMLQFTHPRHEPLKGVLRTPYGFFSNTHIPRPSSRLRG